MADGKVDEGPLTVKEHVPLDRKHPSEVLAELKITRRNAKAAISRTLNNVTGDMSVAELECRMGVLESYYKLCSDTQMKIERLEPENSGRIDIDESYIKAKTKILNFLGDRRQVSMLNETMFTLPQPVDISSINRLPKLNLPKFSGKYSEFKNFITSFESLVHNNSSLCNIDKFNLLLQCLTGQARDTVNTFIVSDTNYIVALDRLKELYDNDCLIFLEHISMLFDVPRMSKGSQPTLRTVVDKVSAIYNAIKSLGTYEQICDALIINIIMSKVDFETRKKWEESLDFKVLPRWSECNSQLDRRCKYLDAYKAANSSQGSVTRAIVHQQSRNQVPNTSYNSKLCYFCSQNGHNMYACPEFIKLSKVQRSEAVFNLQLCFNCLGKGHSQSNCTSRFSCKSCNQRHHSLLHQPDEVHLQPAFDIPCQATTHHQTQVSERHVILATALVLVKDSFGEFKVGRALLDSCSQINFMREDFAHFLRLKKLKCPISIHGVNDAKTKVNYAAQTLIRSRVNGFEATLEFLLTPKVSNYQECSGISMKDLNIPKNIHLADPEFNHGNKIDMLIGGELFFELLSVGQIKLGSNLPMLQKSLFGWLIVGGMSPSNGKVQNLQSHCCCLGQSSLEDLVERFWQLEEVGTKAPIWSAEQTECENFFQKTVTIQNDGKIRVQLPFKRDPLLLGTSYNTAVRRLHAIERRLGKNAVLSAEYTKFMREYESLGHMTQIKKPDLTQPHYFIPHHCVFKPESSTTKLRVVFDASSKTDTNLSLNEMLMVGPTVQNDLFITLLRFRRHRYGVTADITKMYRQVIVDPKHRLFQLILWRENQNQPIKIFSLNTVTYGMSAAPFLAIRSLNFAAELARNNSQIAYDVITSDFYVDDMLSGANCLDDLMQIYNQVTLALKGCGFQLSKWYSNNPKFVSSIGLDPCQSPLIGVNSDPTSTLGINWDPKGDDFSFTFKPSRTNVTHSKRIILSESSTLFDPLGLLSPIIVRAKILLQDLWTMKLDWDESLPQLVESKWQELLKDLSDLHMIRIPRFAFAVAARSIQVHGFCDASIRAYGCVLYIRSELSDGTIGTKLLVSKSKVAPVKQRSLPKLELCSAHLLVKLYNRIKEMVCKPEYSTYFWTDAKIVLHWIKSHSSTLKTFVGNRVAEIQELSPNVSWRYVPSEKNPADMISRGTTVNKLKDSIWIYGPPFLSESITNWPKNIIDLSIEEQALEKRKAAHLACSAVQPLLEYIHKFSDYNKTLRVFAYVSRFINIKCSHKKCSPQLTSEEMNEALFKIISIIQRHYFSKEFNELNSGRSITGNLSGLSLFLDTIGRIALIRVGGRLQNTYLPEEAKHPFLLPKSDNFVISLVRHLHITNYHAGPKSLLAITRERFWILNGRYVATRIVNKCLHCVKYHPKLMQQVMGHLPKNRVTAARPFQYCGVDFCGPILTYLNLRGKTPYKSYIAVFVCFATKAVHLEAVSDLSSNKFIQALKRLVGRRGLPSQIFCDNATNFVGAQSILKNLRDQFFEQTNITEINAYCSQNSIEFKFIPPRAPHFGGIWEAAVKVAKGHLLRTLPHARLTYEELSTVLIEIEAVMNSRPLSPLSSSPNDLQILTPAHFLIGTTLKAIPEPVANIKNDITHIQRWQRINAIKAHFWDRWHKEYLHELQNKTKWKKPTKNLQIGDMVLVHEDNTPAMNWLLGRIVKVIAGSDGQTRVAELKTQKGVIKRPIAKLALLDMC